jgi:hypothetical protein
MCECLIIYHVDYFYSQMWCMFVHSHVYVFVVCGFSCVDDIVYVVINILYVSI